MQQRMPFEKAEPIKARVFTPEEENLLDETLGGGFDGWRGNPDLNQGNRVRQVEEKIRDMRTADPRWHEKPGNRAWLESLKKNPDFWFDNPNADFTAHDKLSGRPVKTPPIEDDSNQ